MPRPDPSLDQIISNHSEAIEKPYHLHRGNLISRAKKLKETGRKRLFRCNQRRARIAVTVTVSRNLKASLMWGKQRGLHVLSQGHMLGKSGLVMKTSENSD